MFNVDRNVARKFFYDLKNYLGLSYKQLGLTDRLVRYYGEGKIKHSEKINKAIKSMISRADTYLIRDYEIYAESYRGTKFNVGWNSLFNGFLRWDYEGYKYFYVGVGRFKRTLYSKYAYINNKWIVKNYYPVAYSLMDYTGVDWDIDIDDEVVRVCKKKYNVLKVSYVKSTNKNKHLLFYADDMFYNRHFSLRKCARDDRKRLNLDLYRFKSNFTFNRLWQKKERISFKKVKELRDIISKPKGNCHNLVALLNDKGLIDVVISFQVKHRFSKNFSWHVVGAKIIDDTYFLFYDFTAGQFKGLKPQMFLVHKDALYDKPLNMPYGWVYIAKEVKPKSFYSFLNK